MPIPTNKGPIAARHLFGYDETNSKWIAVAVDADGTIITEEEVPTIIGSGQKAVASAGTAEALAGSTSIAAVTITALRTNTGNIYVGGSGVDSTNGDVLVRGSGKSYAIADLATVFIDADTNGEGVSFSYVA
jgi:hypothetical protein